MEHGRRAASPGGVSLAAGADRADDEIALYYARHRERVRAFLVGGCGCPVADAEDIVQDTIMTIRSRYWPTVRALAKPEAYWFKIAERRYRRTQGRQAGRVTIVDPADALLDSPAPGDPFAQADLRLSLEPVMRCLPRRQRQVLWLRELAGFSVAETAEILEIGDGSVKTHLNHAKNRVRELLHEESTTWEAETR